MKISRFVLLSIVFIPLMFVASSVDAGCSSSNGCLDCKLKIKGSTYYDCETVSKSAYCVCSDNNSGSCIAGGGSCDYTGPGCGKPICPDVRGPSTTAISLEELSTMLLAAEEQLQEEAPDTSSPVAAEPEEDSVATHP